MIHGDGPKRPTWQSQTCKEFNFRDLHLNVTDDVRCFAFKQGMIASVGMESQSICPSFLIFIVIRHPNVETREFGCTMYNKLRTETVHQVHPRVGDLLVINTVPLMCVTIVKPCMERQS